MERNAMQRLDRWFASPERKPLVIRGARQVGKSTLVRLFAERTGLRLHEINLERHPQLGPVFGGLECRSILSELEFLVDDGPFDESDSLLFLDEIQAVPQAFAALRVLYEDCPGLRVIAAGSLLEFILAEHKFSMPVGRVEYLFLEPMGFGEFLQAAGETPLRELLKSYEWGGEFPQSAHARLLKRLREYLIVGGMPEALRRFIASDSLGEASAAHASILETYRDDFAKYGTRAEVERLQKVYDYSPGAIGRKVKYSQIDRQSRSRELKRAMDLLVMARVVRRVTHSDAVGIPLGATLRQRAFKTYFLDVGLVNSACGLPALARESIFQQNFVNEGPMAEQFIAQHLPLIAPDDRTFVPAYWLREGRANNAEVDFLLQIGARIVPIEVKAGKSGSLKSLLELMHLRGWDRAVRFDTNPPHRATVSHARTHSSPREATEFELYSLPLYMVEELPRLVSS